MNDRHLFDMFGQMERMMEQLQGGRLAGGHDSFDHGRSERSTNLTLTREDDVFVVLADLPGFEQEEIDLRFEDEVLSVSADHEVTEDTETTMLSRSRHVSESVRLPATIDVDGIEATYRNGVLEVRLPVADDATTGHEIDIE